MEDMSVVTAPLVGGVDDPVLDARVARASLFAPMGADEGDDHVDARLPWQFEVPRPVAVDVSTIYSAAAAPAGAPGPFNAPVAADSSTGQPASPGQPGPATEAVPGSVILVRRSMTAWSLQTSAAARSPTWPDT